MPKVTFINTNRLFFQSVKNSVEEYFVENKIRKTGNWELYLKPIILFPLAVGLYLVMLFADYPPLAGILICLAFSFVLVCIAFNVMHDACHGSFSKRNWVNDIMGLTMNALGSDAFLWKIKHNIVHHTYTNVDGVDDDMSKAPVLRMCPQQKWVSAH
ncbi:MAG: fatty acid desaturase, partial [Ginsengibacter sp.]